MVGAPKFVPDRATGEPPRGRTIEPNLGSAFLPPMERTSEPPRKLPMNAVTPPKPVIPVPVTPPSAPPTAAPSPLPIPSAPAKIPAPVMDLLRQVGFAQVDVLHKNVCFAAFGGVKG